MGQEMTTASDMLSYQGNPALGYGSGVDYNYNPNVANPLASLDETLGRVQQQNNQRQNYEYAQAISDRDKLFQYLSDTNKSLFNQKDANGNDISIPLLPEDQKELVNRAHAMRQRVFAHPGKYRWDEGLAQMEMESRLLSRNAQYKAKTAADLRIQAAKEVNPQRRQEILDHIDKEIINKKITDGSPIKPYFPKADYASSDFWDPKQLQDEKLKTSMGVMPDENGNQYEVKAISPGILDNRAKIRSDEKLYWKADQANKDWAQVPAHLDPQYLAQIDKNAKDANSFYGLKPGDAGYIIPISQLPPTADAADMFYSINAPSIALNNKHRELRKDANTIAKEQIGVQKEKADIEHVKKQTAQMDEELDMKRRTLKMNEDKMSAAEIKEKKEELEDISAASTVAKQMTSVNNFKDIDTLIKSVPGGETGSLNAALKDNGIDAAGYKIAFLNPNDQTVMHIAGVQHQKADGGFDTGVKPPQNAYLLKPNSGNLNESKYLINYKEYQVKKGANGSVVIDKSTNKPAVQEVSKWKVVSPEEAIGNSIKSAKNFYNISDKTTEHIDRAIGKFRGILPGEGQPAKKEEKTAPTPQFVPKINGQAAQVRQGDGGPEALVDGSWVKIKGRKPNGELVLQ